jgi:L-ascorbate metabolism protein UlaG (beta-lactamase superfamily)
MTNTIAHLRLPAGKDTFDFERGSIFFVGTATVVLRYAGFTILTDPNFLHQGDHVHLGHGLRAKRLTDPALEIEALPPIDLVVLSHMHEDHFDRIAAEKLDKSLPIVTTQHATEKLQEKGFRALYGLNSWQSLKVFKGSSALTITSMPGRHGPGVLAALLPPVMGSMLEFQDGNDTRFCLYITGDTLVIDQLREIPERYPNIDVGLFHLGGTKAFGILLTMDAKQGLEAVQLIAPKVAIPIHYNDYDVFKSPLEDFQQAVAAAGLEDKVVYLNHGDTYNFEVANISQLH